MTTTLAERIVELSGAMLGDCSIESEIQFILADVRELEDTLRFVQFGNDNICMICNGWNVGPNGTTRNVHTKDCRLAAILTKTGAIK